MTSEQSQQEQAAAAQMQAELARMTIEIKRKLKSESKNELIRIVSALLLDNYALKMHLQQAQEAAKPANTEPTHD